MAVGISQVTVNPYVTEIAPNRCRGAMIAMGYIWQTIGSITCAVMMNFINKRHPLDWLLPVYIEFGLVGLMLVCFLIIPETPWFYGRRGNKEKALRSMKRLYSNIPGYDFEEEYGIIVRSIEHEKELLAQAKGMAWSQIFRGANGVGPSCMPIETDTNRNGCSSS